MQLPEKINVRNTLHGNKGGGGYVYRYSDTEGLGVNVMIVKEKRGAPEVRRYSFDWLPNLDFPTYEGLRAAVAQLSDERIAAEKAKYPVIRSSQAVKHKVVSGYVNRCRLCPFDSASAVPEAFRFSLAINPDGMNDWHFGLCHEHAGQYAFKPVELLAALKNEVAERQANRDAKPRLQDVPDDFQEF